MFSVAHMNLDRVSDGPPVLKLPLLLSFFHLTGSMAGRHRKVMLYWPLVFCLRQVSANGLVFRVDDCGQSGGRTAWRTYASFPSFVKEFNIRYKYDAITLYKELLESPRIKLSWRDRLKTNYADCSLRRLHNFWSSWEKEVETETEQNKLEHSPVMLPKWL